MGPRPVMVGAGAGFALAAAASTWLAVWPCFYRGVEAVAVPPGSPPQPAVGRSTCASLLEINGFRVLWVLILPVALAGVAVLAAGWRRRWLLAAATVGLAAFSVLGGFSVGLAYLPAAAALLLATLVWRPAPAAGADGRPP
ncbi:MAG: hypothetical protein ACOYY2_03510 [Actinomycetota bacterium]